MSSVTEPKWSWQRIDPGGMGVSGDLSKVFKHEPVKAPGVFSVDPPDPAAALLVREVVQNSWDAALESRRSAPTEPITPFEVSFRLRSVSGDRRDELVEHLGLQELATRVAAVDNRRSLGLSEIDCLVNLDEDDDLRLLEISEQAAGGMHGPWTGDDSKLYLALCSVGITPDEPGRGGSYGYGKAGLIRGSAIRSVVAYSCFSERSDDPGVTRRLLGMTYWDRHKIDGVSYTGSARFGSDAPTGEIIPFCNDAADEIASRLGLAVRDPAIAADLGTTILVVEPTVKAADLVVATERYWWPALQEPSLHFEVVVVDEAGDVHYPKPKSNAVLRPFISAYDVATTPQDNRRPNVRRRTLQRSGAFATPGTLGMVAESPGWSYPDYSEGDTGVDHRSLVALVRTPRMVVEYYDAGRTAPYVRGTFVADDSTNESLRLTEPKGHDAWQTESAAGDVRDDHASLARDVLSRIRSHVDSYRRELKPRPKPADELRLPEFDRIMRVLLKGGGPGKSPPPVDVRPFSIQPGGRLEVGSGGRLYLSGTARIEFSDHHSADPVEGDEIEVNVRYRFMEDDHLGGYAEVDIEAPRGFAPVPGRTDTYRGRLKPGTAVEFVYLSEDYDPSWTGRLLVNAELCTDAGSSVRGDNTP